MRDNEVRTLTSSVGRFFFYKETPLSHAKLIRDTVTAQILGTIPSTKGIRIKSATQARLFIEDYLAGPANQTVFGMDLYKEPIS